MRTYQQSVTVINHILHETIFNYEKEIVVSSFVFCASKMGANSEQQKNLRISQKESSDNELC